MTSLSGSSFSMSAGKGARPVSPAMIQVSKNTYTNTFRNTNTCGNINTNEHWKGRPACHSCNDSSEQIHKYKYTYRWKYRWVVDRTPMMQVSGSKWTQLMWPKDQSYEHDWDCDSWPQLWTRLTSSAKDPYPEKGNILPEMKLAKIFIIKTIFA